MFPYKIKSQKKKYKVFKGIECSSLILTFDLHDRLVPREEGTSRRIEGMQSESTGRQMESCTGGFRRIVYWWKVQGGTRNLGACISLILHLSPRDLHEAQLWELRLRLKIKVSWVKGLFFYSICLNSSTEGSAVSQDQTYLHPDLPTWLIFFHVHTASLVQIQTAQLLTLLWEMKYIILFFFPRLGFSV